MEFKVAILFLFLYYIRPQDWVSGLAGFNIIRPVMLIWMATAFSSRDRNPLPGLLRTPHDWLMLLYLAYVVWGSADVSDALNGFVPLVAFYALTVRSLSSWERLLLYLKAWNYMLLGIAFMAVASLYGLDLTGAIDMTASMENRLCIGTWLHNNPNALGHSVIVAIPLSYILYFWRGNALGRFIIFPLFTALATMCVYYTESKGAFVVGGALVVMIFVVGRPLAIKALALSLASTVGISALSFLPRMSQMNSIRTEPGVMGRLLAWDMARTTMQTHTTGLGWKQFFAMIRWDGMVIGKSTHSSYVQVGADLGMIGIGVYLASMWASIRSLLNVHRITVDVTDWERCRRGGIILVLSYLFSSWMINREYHTEYFLIVAFAAAIHRLNLLHDIEETETEKEKDSGEEEKERQSDAIGGMKLSFNMRGANALPRLQVTTDSAEAVLRPSWQRFGWPDIFVCAALTWGVLWIWDYILRDL